MGNSGYFTPIKGVEGPLLAMGDVITKPQLSSGNVRPTNDMNHESSWLVKMFRDPYFIACEITPLSVV